MMFGNPEDFAIEVESDATDASPASTVWGHMRIWCRGVSFGDFKERHCGLSGTHQALVRLSATLHELISKEFPGLDDSGVWHFLDQKLYRDDERTLSEVDRDAREYSRFDFLTNWGESFDDYKGFVFCRDDGVHAVVMGPGAYELRCVRVSQHGFRSAVAGFDAWCLEVEAERGRR
jgi:hypothetical protein